MALSAAETGTLAAGSVLESIASFVEKARNANDYMKTSKLTDVTSVARVEPLAIIDSDSFNSELIGAALQCAHNIFTAQYVQAISLFGNIGNINVVKTLDRLNPNRKPESAGFFGKMFAPENYEHFNLSMESFKLPNYAAEAKDDDADIVTNTHVANASKTITDMANLSVGRLVEVSIQDQGKEIKIPVAIRLIVNELPQSPMLRLMSLQGLDRSFTERWYKWRAGRIGFVKDLMLMRDLVREDKKAMMQDEHGVLSEIMRRAKNSKLAGFYSKNASMNEASNIIIFSEETAKQLKNLHNLDVDNFKHRQTIFDGSYALIMIKIDREYERVTFYQNGQAMASSLNKNEVKSAASKNSGSELMEIFQALKKSDSASLF
jgi:hypothetical protein